MTTQDPFTALDRSCDAFTLEAAARIVCDVPLSRRYPRRPQDWTQALRDEHGAISEALKQLQADAATLGVSVTPVSEQVTWAHNDFTDKDYVQRREPVRTDYGKVGRAALQAWCDSKGMHPVFFCQPSQAASPAANPLQTRERETLLALIGVLCEAAGIDLRAETRGHAEAKRIARWATVRNVTTSKETIATHVVKARELIAPKGPVEQPAGAGGSNSNRRNTNSNS